MLPLFLIQFLSSGLLIQFISSTVVVLIPSVLPSFPTPRQESIYYPLQTLYKILWIKFYRSSINLYSMRKRRFFFSTPTYILVFSVNISLSSTTEPSSILTTFRSSKFSWFLYWKFSVQSLLEHFLFPYQSLWPFNHVTYSVLDSSSKFSSLPTVILVKVQWLHSFLHFSLQVITSYKGGMFPLSTLWELSCVIHFINNTQNCHTQWKLKLLYKVKFEYIKLKILPTQIVLERLENCEIVHQESVGLTRSTT